MFIARTPATRSGTVRRGGDSSCRVLNKFHSASPDGAAFWSCRESINIALLRSENHSACIQFPLFPPRSLATCILQVIRQ